MMRNTEKRAALRKEIERIEAEKQAMIAALPDDLSDDEWDAAFVAICDSHKTDMIYTELQALGYKECRNQWFKGFVESFGVCNDKRVSRKQADILIRYSEDDSEMPRFRGKNYYARVGKKLVKTTVYPEAAYITVIEF